MRSSLARVTFMERPELIPVTAVYALPARQVIVHMKVGAGATVDDVVQASGLSRRFADVVEAPCAIFGRPVTRSQVVRAGDRIEILRPLLVDPKEGRRRAAAAGRAKRT